MSSPITKKKKKSINLSLTLVVVVMVVGEGVSVAPSRVYLKYYTLLGYENFSMNQYLLKK